jgi:3-hydroxyisobutyrate dehydrogenase
MERIGFIGLGTMGAPMARNLLRAGFPLTVFNRTESKSESLRAAGASVGRSPQEVTERSDVIITIVRDTPDVEAVWFGEGGIAGASHPGLVAIDMSTISPDATRSFAERARSAGFSAIDAPVSGGPTGAESASLSIMIGGDESDVARAMPIFQALGKTIIHVGGHGAGQVCKLANQICVVLNNLGTSEALVFAARQGIDLEKTRQVISAGAGSSWSMQNSAPKMLVGDFRPGFSIDLQQKDLRLVLDEAYSSHVSLPGASLVHSLYNALQAEGRGAESTLALITVLERLAGVSARSG